jgi:hypothetical protein
MVLGKTDLWSLRNSIMTLGLDFMPPNKIGYMSLNGVRRRVVTRDKTKTRSQMDEMLVELDPDHPVLASEAPPLSFHPPKNPLCEYLWH